MKYPGHISDGKIIQNPSYAKILKEFLRKNEGKKVEFEVKVKRARRSDSQNAYYFGVVVHLIHIAFINLGNEFDKGDIHYFLKSKFNGVTVEGSTIGQSTAKLDKLAFCDYISSIQKWAAEMLDLFIPDPINELV